MAPGENARLATRLRIRLSVALALVTFACFSSGLGNDFVNWDDPINILQNTDFRGLSQANLEWMFTTHAGHYIPLTWLTLALDYVVWGMDPFGYHLTSLIFHALNAVLFFHVVWWLLARAFRDRAPLHDVRLLWVAATGALLHSIHPLRVESVSWVTERRDVVCGTFFLLALLAYFRKHDVVDAKVRRRWGWVSIGFFLLSLMSKLLGAALPLVLLALDFYPLRRVTERGRAKWRTLVVEKIPYVALVLVAAVAGMVSQRSNDALFESDFYPIWQRLFQPGYRLLFYLGKMIAPVDLSPVYLLEIHAGRIETKNLLSAVAAVAITIVLVKGRRRWPAVLSAWCCFVTLLIPVLGVVQIGLWFAADRFTYLAAMPWTIVLAGGLYEIILRAGAAPSPDRRVRAASRVAIGGSIAILILLGGLTLRQARIWRSSIVLWNHALRINPRLAVGYERRGTARRDGGDLDGALADYDSALRIMPTEFHALLHRGVTRAMKGDLDGAIADWTRVLAINPRSKDAPRSLAEAYARRAEAAMKNGRLDSAIADGSLALKFDPVHLDALGVRGLSRLTKGDRDGAIADLSQLLSRAPAGWPNREICVRALAEARQRR